MFVYSTRNFIKLIFTYIYSLRELNNLLISRTFSKAFALASFRIGYLISCSNNIEIINRIRNPKNISLFAQEAAIAALEDIDYTNNYVKSVDIAKTNFINFLK